MYEYQSKKITTYKELESVCRKATSYFIASFMLEMIMRRKEWENPATKTAFIESIHSQYLDHWPIERIRSRVNCMIRIIESDMIIPALEYVTRANDSKLDDPSLKSYATEIIRMIDTGKLDVENSIIHYDME